MAYRKTVCLNKLVDHGNDYLANSDASDVAGRKGVTYMIERALLDADNYGGFRYLGSNEVPDGALPGCRVVMGEERYRMVDGKKVDTWFENTDETRRQYGLKRYNT
jgi:hypothetical protein